MFSAKQIRLVYRISVLVDDRDTGCEVRKEISTKIEVSVGTGPFWTKAKKKPAIVLAGMKGMVLNLLAGPCE